MRSRTPGSVSLRSLARGTHPARSRARAPQVADPGVHEGLALRLPFETCFHGGAFFEAIGEGFRTLERRRRIVPADVLDAWFPPAPAVIDTLRQHLEWIVRTSPPVNADGLVRAIAAARGVPPSSLAIGGGSSDLIFLALSTWLGRESRVLLLDPTYGEYAHVLEQVVGCQVDRLPLRRDQRYRVDVSELELILRHGYDLVVIVNPNSPTGQHLPAKALAELVARAPERTRIWVDETYVEYAGSGESLERLASVHDRLVVCKSMSKAYALSGLRAAYLVTSPQAAATLRRRTPPWAIGLPGQIAAVRALESQDYYRARWAETHQLREDLTRALSAIPGLEVIPGIANFLLFHLAPHQPTARTVVGRCRTHGVFLRDAGVTSTILGDRAIRIAVRDGETNSRMASVLEEAVRAGGGT